MSGKCAWAAVGLGLTVWVASAPAQQSLGGTRSQIQARGVVNFKALAHQSQRRIVVSSNGEPFLLTRSRRDASAPPRAIHPPLPLGQQLPPAPAPAPPDSEPDTQNPELRPASAPLPDSPPPASSFEALLDNGAVIPPDTMGAVGLNHLMVVLNSEVRIQDRNGTNLSTVLLEDFWLSLGPMNVFDPKVLYDSTADRWIFVAMAEARLPTSSVLLGVSQTGDPTGNWYLFRLPGDFTGLDWADFPSIGFNRQWVAIGANMFTRAADAFTGVNLYVLDKQALYNNTIGFFAAFAEYSGQGFTMTPAVTYDTNLAELYIVEVDNLILNYGGTSSRLRISTLSGTPGNETLTLGTGFTPATNVWGSSEPFAAIFTGGFLPQLGSPFGITANDSRLNNVVYRNGSLWCSHHVFLPAQNPTRTAAQWWQLTPAGAVQQFGRLDNPASGHSYAYVSLAVNGRNDVLLGFSRFSTNQYASGNYAVHFAGDPPGALRRDAVFKAGEAPYAKTFSGFRNRWGDYSASQVDPQNDVDFWTIQEYAARPLAGVDRWGTWWARVVMGNLTQFQRPDYSVLEGASPGLAAIAVYNFGGSPGTVEFATSDGTAVAGIDYLPRNGTLAFAAGQIVTNFDIIILDNPLADGDRRVNLRLLNPSAGLTLGALSNAVLTIVDDESLPPVSTAGEFNFSDYVDNSLFEVTENESLDFAPGPYSSFTQRSALGALVTVVRTNGAMGRVLVDFATLPGGTAVPGLDYIPTNGTLVLDDYQMSTNFLVTILPFSTTAGPLFVPIALSNPRPDPAEEAQRPGLIRPTLGPGSQSGIYINKLNFGYCTPSFTGITNVCLNAFAFVRRWWRMDEYPNRDPRTLGGVNTIDLDIVLPLGGPGTVRVVVWSLVSGSQLMAGSDHALSPGAGSIVWPNPVITTNGPMTLITNLADYQAQTVDLTFAPNQTRRSITLVVSNDLEVEFNEDVTIDLIRLPNNPPVHPYASVANVTVLYDDQPAGALDREWNVDDVEGTSPPFNPAPGANNVVNAVVVQPDGKTVLGGDFSHVNAVYRPYVARLNVDGSLDPTFNPFGGPDGSVSSVLLYPPSSPFAGQILIGGNFTSYNGTQRNGVARLLPGGQLDPTFFPGTGTDGPVRAMALQADGKVVIGGDFFYYNDVERSGIARLNSDGSLDTTFNAGSGPDGSIWTVALAPGGLGAEFVLAGGAFAFFNGEYYGGVVRLATDGSLDLTFDPGGSANGPVYALAVQTNGAVLVAGGFTEFDTRRRVGLARLLPDGALDESYDPGTGTDSSIYALTLQPNQLALIGGPFTSYNNTRRMGLARVRLDGALDTSFMDTAYNQYAGLPKTLSFEPPNYVNAIALQPNGHVMIGGSFTNVGGNPSYAVPVRHHYTVFTRADKRARYNIARLIGGVTPGPGNAEYDSGDYYVDENAGAAFIKLQRTDGRLGALLAEAATTDRTATNLLDYIATNLVSEWPQWFYQTNYDPNFGFALVAPTNFAPLSVGKVWPNYLRIPLIDDVLREGDEIVDLSFVRPFGQIVLGGEYIPLGGALGRDKARLIIGDNDFDKGVFNFAAPIFLTNENARFALVTVVRTNGTDGTVAVDYYTRDSFLSPIATANSDYRPAGGRLTFRPGESNRTFTVEILNDFAVEFDEYIGLVLTNATGGAKLPGGQPNSVATANILIVDDDYPSGRLNFAASTFVTNENASAAVITVTRSGGNQNAISTQFRVANGTAIAGVDHTATNGTLSWNSGESTPKTFTVPLLPDGVVDGTRTVRLFLTNALRGLTPDFQLFGARTNATLEILDDDAYGTLAFSQPFYEADENGGVATITVVRQAGLAGSIAVDYDTTPVDPLSPGSDYLPASGTLSFLPGESSKSFQVTLLDDSLADGNKDIVVRLFNPVNASLGLPNPVVLTIVDNESFNIPAGQVDTTFNENIQTDGPIYGLALEPAGQLVLAGDFTQVNNVPKRGVARLRPDGGLDPSFDPGTGANGSIRALARQPDGRVLVGGFFTEIQSTNRNRLARLNHDGSLDASFNPGAGADNPVYAILVQPDNKILVGGAFSGFNSISRPGVVRLNTNGTVDLTFNTGAGANGTVFALAQQPNGKLLVGGDFTAINGVPRLRLARLNPNGSLDASFDPGLGFDGAVRTIVVAPDGRIVVGGSFTSALGQPRNYLARLHADGTLDAAFLAPPLVGADNAVYALVQQVDGKLVVGGDFARFNGVSRNRITRLNPDGSTDATINFGAGANGFVAALVVQPDRKIVLAGGFTAYDDLPRLRLARIYGGSVTGAGALEFSRPVFFVNENGTNAAIIVRRRGGTTGDVSVNYSAFEGTALAGIHFTPVTGTVSFASGETRSGFLVPVIDNSVPSGDLTVNLELGPGTYSGGATSGPQPRAVLVIQDDEGLISFTTAHQSVNENVASGVATIVVTRTGGTNQPASVNFLSLNGTATALADYLPTNGTLFFLPGEAVKNFRVSILNDTNIEGNEYLFLLLTNASGSNVLGIAQSQLTIVDDDFASGQLTFSSFTYTNVEGNPYALITVLRTNGSTGFVTVRYRTTDGIALGGLDYEPTNNILAFADGETVKSFAVLVYDDLLLEATETVSISLFNPAGGAGLGAITNATLYIVDNDFSQILPAGSVLLSESFAPPNLAIDPGETVTVLLGLRNVGNVNASNVVGTLVPAFGIVQPSGPQSFGNLLANGPVVSRPYSFRAISGALGERIIATIFLVDAFGNTNTVQFPFTLGGQTSNTFVNLTPIQILDDRPAIPYPSIITIPNLGGLITSISVTLYNLSHGYPDDVDILLVGPRGEQALLMSDAGGNLPAAGVTFTLSDSASAPVPDAGPLVNGATYRPANYAGIETGDFFAPPAPPPPYTNSPLSVFLNTSPIGEWSLFLVDDTSLDAGTLGGWSLSLSTADPLLQAADLGLTAQLSTTATWVGALVTNIFTLTNRGPAVATQLGLTNRLGAGLSFVSASTTRGAGTGSGGFFTWTMGSLTNGGRATATVVMRATAAGMVTNTSFIVASQLDANSEDNLTTSLITITPLPRLVVDRQGPNIVLTWPASATGFVPQGASALGTPWSTLTGVTAEGGKKQLIITLPHSNNFFRLKAQ